MDAVGIGDLHTDGSLKNYVPNHHEFIFGELDSIVQKHAVDRGVKHVFLYGDVCHGPRMSYESNLGFIALADKYPRLVFHIIPGNHDILNSEDATHGHSLEILKAVKRPNLRIYDTPTNVMIDGAKVRFLPYPHTSFSMAALNVAHVDVAGAKLPNGRDVKSTVKSNAVAVVGHVHHMQQVRNTYYSGTPYQTRMGEPLNNFIHYIRFNSPNDYDIEPVPHKPKYRLHTVVVNTKDDLKKAPSKKGDLLRLVISDGVDVGPSDWDHLNVVQHNTFRSRAELSAIMNKDVTEAVEIQFDIPEFLTAWMASVGTDHSRQEHLLTLRKSIIRG